MANQKNAFFTFELTTTDLAKELQFRVDRKIGSFFLVTYPAICVVLLVLCSLVAFTAEDPPQWSVGIAIGTAINLVAWPILMLIARANPTTKLSVTSERFLASGRGVGANPWNSGTADLPVAEVNWIGYLPSQPPGLYLSRGFMQNTCVLPGLNREMTNSVIDVIVGRFPECQSKMEQGL
jgi:hypothetical protein